MTGKVFWQSLVHNGVYFPPTRRPLPASVRLTYKGDVVALDEQQEEAACLYAKEMENADSVVRRNFWADFRRMLGRKDLSDFSQFDFSRIAGYLASEPRVPLGDPETLRKYRTCTVDGVEETVANFVVEPPGLFKGRGNHPLRGRIKKRIQPSDVTLNISKGVPVPEPNVPGRWKKVVHDGKAMWIAAWRQNVTGKMHYVYLSQGSQARMRNDRDKFDVARKLAGRVEKIRKTVDLMLRSQNMEEAQLATAVWMMDHLAIRVGNEKGDDEAQTVGVTSLAVKNLKLLPGNKVRLDFLGKDSIRYSKTVDVPEQVQDNIRRFADGKEEEDYLLDLIDSRAVNEFLDTLMPGLTAKVFRTMNSSVLFEQLLRKLVKKDMKPADILKVYSLATIAVAELCNHQKAKASKGRDTKKLDERIRKASGEHKKSLQLMKKVRVAMKTLNISTSRQNYIDPRITVAFSKEHGIPLERFFSKRLLEKFIWAKDTKKEFRF